jgi:tripartite-type tricarboxylate transporter receptor subunit TctC
MINKQMLTNFSVLASLLLPGICLAQSATDNYPTKSVRIIAPFPPGGSVDTVGRLIAARLSESFGQQFVIDNRGGASGNIGTEIAMRAPADGYTLLVNTLPLVTNPLLYSKAPYEVLRDFAPVSLLTGTTSMLAVHPSLPVKTVKDLLQLARTKGNSLNYGTAGVGTNPHIAGELLNYLGKVNITAVHFKGGGPALIAAVSGEISIGISTFPDTLTYVRAGRLRPLGVTGLKRAPQLPETPTLAESGLPGYEFTTWQGLLAPRNTPRAITATLSERIRKALSTPEQIKRFSDAGLDIIASTPDEFAAHLKTEVEKWSKVVKERGIKAE